MIQDVLAQGPALGNYLAIWKVGVFVVLFLAWAWIGQWVNRDTRLVHTNQSFWNSLYLWLGVAAMAAWLALPFPFLVALLIFLVIWLTIDIVYVLHRNSLVDPEDKILTVGHLQHLLAREKRAKKPKARFIFISAHGNDLPVPTRQEAEYDGFVVAEDLVHNAHLRRASRTELLPAGEVTNIRLVIDGVLTDGGERERAEIEQAVAYLKAVAGLDVKERRRPQQGEFSIKVEGEKTRWSLETSGSTRGEFVRITQQQEALTLKVDELGFLPDQLEQFRDVINRPEGIVIVSGLPASGVSTTLYSILREHDAFTTNINTLELDPLTDLDNITQHVLEKGTPPKDCARRLGTVLRAEPDVTMVGFCNTPEIAQQVTKSALDNKKIYIALESASCFHALQEWLKMVGRADRVAPSLVAILNQRLLRKLCVDCREAYTPEPAMLRRLNLPADKIKHFYRPPTEIEYDKHGDPILCETCQGIGYRGRTAVFELLVLTDTLRQMLKDNAPLAALQTQCRKERMLYLQEQALRRVLEGVTSIQEILRVTSEKAKSGAKKPAATKPEQSS